MNNNIVFNTRIVVVARAYLLKIFMLIIYCVGNFHAFNFRESRVPTKITLNISRFTVDPRAFTEISQSELDELLKLSNLQIPIVEKL